MSYDDASHATQERNTREALLCARLNLRGARRLLHKGAQRRGIAALYDSVLFGMQYYVTRHDDCADIDIADATGLFHLLTRLGIFEDPLAFNRLSLTVELALWQEAVSLDTHAILEEVEEILTRLGVMTFQKSTLLKKSKISH